MLRQYISGYPNRVDREWTERGWRMDRTPATRVLSVMASLEKSRTSLQTGVGAEPLFMLRCDRDIGHADLISSLDISRWTRARLDADNRLYQATTTYDLDRSQDL
jgi:hypothetical protein